MLPTLSQRPHSLCGGFHNKIAGKVAINIGTTGRIPISAILSSINNQPHWATVCSAWFSILEDTILSFLRLTILILDSTM
ncbi:MAG: hypothetical protein WCF23_02755 [Candidatus Nitrosopolaris sp.]